MKRLRWCGYHNRSDTQRLVIVFQRRTSRRRAKKTFVRNSSRDRRYLELDDGTPFIPIGLNICFERYATGGSEIPEKMDHRFRQLAANGGNFARVWAGVSFWNPDAPRGGAIDEVRARRLDALIASARRHGIRL